MTSAESLESILADFEDFAAEQQRQNVLTRAVVAHRAMTDAHNRMSEVLALASELEVSDEEVAERCGVPFSTVEAWRIG